MQRRRFLQTAALGLAMPPLISLPAAADGMTRNWTAALGHGFGLALHDFSDATLDVAADAGFTLIRTDFFWSAVETKRHVYDWTVYDALMKGLVARNLRPQFVLGFNNPEIYGGRWMEGITMSFEVQAFAAFAAAAVERYRALNPIWEVYNEPNRTNFWEPAANPAEYMALVRATISAIRRAQPDAIVIAPALGHKMDEPVLDTDFLEACLKEGLLPMIDGISIHPYVDPEAVEQSYAKVRALIESYNGEGRDIAILSTEWGFATNKFVSDDLQADVLVRMFLMNRSFGIPISIAYVAVDRTEAYVPEEERTYGIVRADYTPKAAFTFLQDMTTRLRGMRFKERRVSDPADFILAFGDDSRTLVAAWTSGEPRDAVINGTAVPLTSRPIYLDG